LCPLYCLLAQACGLRLQLVGSNGVYRAFTCVDPTANPGPIPLALSGALQLRSLGAGGFPPSVRCPWCFNRPRRVLRMGPQVLSGFPQQDNYSRRLVSQHLLSLLCRFGNFSRDERPRGSLPAFAWDTVRQTVFPFNPYPSHYRKAFAFSTILCPPAQQLALRLTCL
jgi:hypothetical protein